MTWQEPKTDWAVNPKNPMAEDFNRIEGNIQALKDDIEIKKGDIVNALRNIGMDVSITDTYEDIANKIKAADQGTRIITPGTSNKTIPKGFHSGSGYVKGDSNLKASNIKSGVSIFGVGGEIKATKLTGERRNTSTFTVYTDFVPYAVWVYLHSEADSNYDSWKQAIKNHSTITSWGNYKYKRPDWDIEINSNSVRFVGDTQDPILDKVDYAIFGVKNLPAW